MLILGLDSSTASISLAICRDRTVLAERTLLASGRQGEHIIPSISDALRELCLSLRDIEQFVIGEGPGSYTGLRIGFATVKALCFATGKPLAAVSSLMASCWNAPNVSKILCPVIDARALEVYIGQYRWNAQVLQTIAADRVASHAKAAAQIPDNAIVYGDGAPLVASALFHRSRPGIEFVAFSPLVLARHIVALWLEQRSNEGGQGHSLAAREPRYLRPSEAERKSHVEKTT